jgi:LysM repeat protein
MTSEPNYNSFVTDEPVETGLKGELTVRDAYVARKEEPPPTEYTVKSGDTFSEIAAAHGTTTEALKHENNISGNTIYVGDVLNIPAKESDSTEVFYERISSAALGQEVWIAVAYMGEIDSGTVELVEKEPLLSESGTLKVLQDGSETSTIELQEPEEERWQGYRMVAKVKLRPESDEDLDKWREKLTSEDGEPGKSLLSITVTAEDGEEVEEVQYRGTDNGPVFLNEEDDWVEVRNRKDGYIICRDGSIEINGKNKSVARFYLENKSGEVEFIGKFEKNENDLIQLPSSFNFKSNDTGLSFGFSVKKGNEYRSYINPSAFAAVMGALSQTGTQDLTIVGFSIADGSSPPPSKSHINGRNGDFRYLRTDKSGGPLYINESPELLDEKRQNALNDALYKYGYKDLLSYQYVKEDEQKLLSHTRHFVNHHHHLHIQGFDPKIKNTQ